MKKFGIISLIAITGSLAMFGIQYAIGSIDQDLNPQIHYMDEWHPKSVSPTTEEKLDIEGGVKINTLNADILHQQTDFCEGFIISKVNNKEARSVRELISIMENRKGGTMLEGIYEDIPGTFYYAFGIWASCMDFHQDKFLFV